jgi:hypothetical protein
MIEDQFDPYKKYREGTAKEPEATFVNVFADVQDFRGLFEKIFKIRKENPTFCKGTMINDICDLRDEVNSVNLENVLASPKFLSITPEHGLQPAVRGLLIKLSQIPKQEMRGGYSTDLGNFLDGKKI